MSRQQDRRSPQRPASLSITQEDMQAYGNEARKGLITINAADLRVWELVTDTPQIGIVYAYICLVLNIFFPGVGTMICACLGDSNINKTQLGVGITQLLTSVYLIGWISSIYWGYLIVKKSKGDHNEIKGLISAATGQPSTTGASTGTNDGARAGRKPNNPFDDGEIAPAQ